jgi:hypothetical protein
MRRLVTPQAILGVLMAFSRRAQPLRNHRCHPGVSYVSGPHRWEPHERGG